MKRKYIKANIEVFELSSLSMLDTFSSPQGLVVEDFFDLDLTVDELTEMTEDDFIGLN